MAAAPLHALLSAAAALARDAGSGRCDLNELARRMVEAEPAVVRVNENMARLQRALKDTEKHIDESLAVAPPALASALATLQRLPPPAPRAPRPA